ncbi:MAG: translation initiation factor IF-2 N-terminal domain-containing protein, partial [Prochlorothrix sp.]
MNNGKVRIYELSKELELDNKDILAVCERLEIAVKSHSSTISEEEAARIRSSALEIFPSARSATQQSDNAAKRPPRSRQGVKKQQILEVRSHYPSSPNDSDATLVKPPTRPVPSASSAPVPSNPPTAASTPTVPQASESSPPTAAAPPTTPVAETVGSNHVGSSAGSSQGSSNGSVKGSANASRGQSASGSEGRSAKANGSSEPSGPNVVLQGPPQRKAATAPKAPTSPTAPNAPAAPTAPEVEGEAAPS